MNKLKDTIFNSIKPVLQSVVAQALAWPARLKPVLQSFSRSTSFSLVLTRLKSVLQHAFCSTSFSLVLTRLKSALRPIRSTSFSLANNIRIPLITVLILLIVFGLIPQSSEPTFGAYSTDSRDADNNAHLASNTVNDTTLYDTSQDSSADTQQQLGVDPNWANGITRKSSALKFDGSNDFVNVPQAGLQFNSSSITEEAWVKLNTIGINQRIFTFDSGQAVSLYFANTNQIYGVVSGGCTSPSSGVLSLSAGVWYHVAMVVDRGKNRVYIFLNGTIVASYVANCSSAINPSSPLMIGGHPSGGPFNGVIDEARISLSAQYTSNFTPARRFTEDANTIGLWHFDEGSCEGANPCYVKDSSQYANNGRLMNGTTNTPAADGSVNGPIFVSGSNAIMDGFSTGSNSNYSSSGAGAQSRSGQTGAGNISLGEDSSTTSDKSYEVKTVASSGLNFVAASLNYALTANNIFSSAQLASGTLDLWMNTSTEQNNVRLFDSEGYILLRQNTGGTLSACSDGACNYLTSTATINDGKWHHVAMTWTSTQTALFIDGSSQGSINNAGSPALDSLSRTTSIGSLWSGANNYYNGTIDEVRVSGSVRYTGNFTPSRRYSTDANTVGLWHFDEGTGNSTVDSSGNNNTGDLTGHAPTWTDGIVASNSSNSTNGSNLSYSSSNWALKNYQFRERIKAQNAVASTLDAGYGLETTKDFGALADNKQARADGNDRRVVYQPADAKRSLSFDGGDKITIPNNNTLNLDTSISISTWINPSSLPTSGNYVEVIKKAVSNSDRYDLYIRGSDKKMTLTTNSSEGSVFTTQPVIASKWQHVVASYGAGKLTMFINGEASASVNMSILNSGGAGANLIFGTSYFGSIDDTRIYNSALTPSQVSALYNGGAGINTPLGGEVGWWAFDEGSGQVVLDKSSNNNNGTLGATSAVNTDDPTWSTDGVVSTAQEVPRFVPNGHALNFSGTTNYVSGNLARSGTKLTLDAWVKISGLPGEGLTAKIISLESGTHYLDVLTSGGIPYFRMVVGNVAAGVALGSTSRSLNTWYHVAGTYDGATVRLYVNGALDASKAYVNALPSTSSFMIATNVIGGTKFSGVIDEARISNSVRFVNNFTPTTTPVAKDASTLGLWHMDEGSGVSLTDSSGNGNTGDLTGHAPTWVTNGGYVKSTNQTDFKSIAPIAASGSDTDYYLYYGNLNEKGSPLSYTATGLKFDGTDDYVSIPNASSLNPTAAITVGGWAYLSDPTITYDMLVNKDGNGGNPSQYTLRLFNATGTVQFRINGSGSTVTTNPLNANTWYHIMGVYNGTDVRIYIDGALAGTPSNYSTAMSDNGQNLTIGRRNTDGYYNRGLLEDVRIYSRALSAPEVTGLYTNSPYVSNSGLVGWWRFNDGASAASTTATDSSGSGNTGTLTNFNFDQNSNWVVNNSLLHASTEPTVSMMSSVIEQESPMFYQYRDSTGGPTPTYSAWSTRAPISATLQQLGATGVYVKFNPSGAYSTQDTYRIASWAVEAFSTSSPQRGKERSFPAKANLIATASGLSIVNATNNKVWMRFSNAGLLKLASQGGNSIAKVEGLNGQLYVANGSYAFAVRFDTDDAVAFSSGGNGIYPYDLAKRETSTFPNPSSGSVVSTYTTSVQPKVIGTNPPKQYLAIGGRQKIASVQDVNSIGQTNGSAVPIILYDTGNSGSWIYDLALTSGGTLYASVSYYNLLLRYDNIQNDTVTKSWDRLYNAHSNPYPLSTPALRSDIINDISVTEGTSLADYTSNQVALATDLGVEVIHEHSTMASGYVEHYTSTGTVGSSKYSSKQFGNALSYNGSQYATFGTPSSLNLGVNSFTIEGWIYPTNNTHMRLVSQWNGMTAGYNISFNFSDLQVNLYSGVNTLFYRAGVVSLNTWSHFAVVVDRDLNQMRIYINGSQAGVSQDITGFGTLTGGVATCLGTASYACASADYKWYGSMDELRISNSVRYSTNFTPSAASFIKDANTLGLYHFDERYGGVAGINGQYVYDDSGNNNNGTLGAAATAGTDDPLRVSPSIAGADKVTAVGMNKSNDPGNAVQLDGVDDYVYVGDPANGSLDFGLNSFSFGIWYYATSYTTGTEQLIYKGAEQGNSTGYEIAKIYSNSVNKINFAICRDPSNWGGVLTATAPSLNMWHYMLAVVDRTNNRMDAYIDGVNVGTDSDISNVGDISGTRPLKFGHYSNLQAFIGSLSNAQIFNRALTGADIAALYNGGLGRTISPVSGNVGWWRINEGGGQTVRDASSNANHGTLGQSATVETIDPTWSTGSPVKEQSALWVGTNGAGANDGAVTAISQATGRQITSYTTANSSLPDNDVTSLSLGTGGLALVGTEVGAWPAGMAGFVVEDTATAPANIVQPLRLKGNTRLKGGIRLK